MSIANLRRLEASLLFLLASISPVDANEQPMVTGPSIRVFASQSVEDKFENRLMLYRSGAVSACENIERDYAERNARTDRIATRLMLKCERDVIAAKLMHDVSGANIEASKAALELWIVNISNKVFERSGFPEFIIDQLRQAAPIKTWSQDKNFIFYRMVHGVIISGHENMLMDAVSTRSDASDFSRFMDWYYDINQFYEHIQR